MSRVPALTGRAAALLAGCALAFMGSTTATAADVVNCPTRPELKPGEWKWVLPPDRSRPDPSARRVVVFVHGMLSDAISAWTKPSIRNFLLSFGDKEFWPCLVATSKELGNPDVLVFEYESGATLSAPSIDVAAQQLAFALVSSGAANSREIVFVSHSLGGIVTRSTLAGPGISLRNSVQAVFLHGSPSDVLALAKIGRAFPRVRWAANLANPDFFAKLNAQWTNLNFRTYCAFELESLLGWFGEVLVPRESAVIPCPQSCRQFPLQLDHVEIVKPGDAGDPPHRVLVTSIEMLTSGEAQLKLDGAIWEQFERAIWQALRQSPNDFASLRPHLAGGRDFVFFDTEREDQGPDTVAPTFVPDYLARRIAWDVEQPTIYPRPPRRESVRRFIDSYCLGAVSSYLASREPRIRTDDIAITYGPLDAWIGQITAIARQTESGPRLVGLVIVPSYSPREELRRELGRPAQRQISK